MRIWLGGRGDPDRRTRCPYMEDIHRANHGLKWDGTTMGMGPANEISQ